MPTAQTAEVLPIDQLRLGLYVYIDLKWFDHPFAFNHFKIKSQDQIDTLRGLGLKQIRFNPELSDPPPAVPAQAARPAKPASAPEAVPVPSAAMQAKRALIAQMQARRAQAERIEQAFVDTANTIKRIERDIYSRPAETLKATTELVQQIADSILGAPELAIQVMGDRLGGEELYFHSLNVAMLALMVARDLALPTEVISALGVGALLHDIGRKEVPDKILLKTEPLTPAERSFYELHPQYGVEMVQRMKLAPAALSIIGQHHEMVDGSGYPKHLKGDAIHLLARIVGITNYYDELCNPLVLANALTPHEALSLMFAKLRSKFDPMVLKVFIRCLGVYPPGTLVQLNNGSLGMVTTVNTEHPMRPLVMVFDADVPKEEAMVLDLDQDAELRIAKAIRPAQVPREVYQYLSPRKHVSYYFDAQAPRGGKRAQGS